MSGHAGHVHGPTSGKKLWLSLAITLLFCAGETVAGLVSHSLALLSDAGHNVSDAIALGLAAYAASVMTKPAAGRHTFGYYRVSTLTALFNSSTLVVIAVLIAFGAVGRFRHPEPVAGNIMIGVACISVFMNTVIALALSGDAKKSLNSRAAFVHMAGDALSAFAVVIAGLGVRYLGWVHADAVVSVLISIVILASAVGILRESTHILMETVPKGIDLDRLAASIQRMDPVCSVHDLHIWTMGEGRNFLSCHVALPAGCSLAQSATITAGICSMLHDDFAIEHATIQAEETGSCTQHQQDTLYCTAEAHVHAGHHHHH